jgi:REP element-mobilizing transposase RayT
MANTYTSLHYHIVFSTKNRERWIYPEIEERVWSYLAGIAKQNKMTPIQIGGVADHVHLLTTLPRTLCIADFVKEVKRVSTGWIQERGGLFAQFHWQAGYGCFSVSESMVQKVVRYIEGQEEHHRVITFQDEYRELLRRHGQKWEEQYVWD